MEVTYSCETSVDFQRTICWYIPKQRTIHNRRCQILKSYIATNFWNIHVPTKLLLPGAIACCDLLEHCVTIISLKIVVIFLHRDILVWQNFFHSSAKRNQLIWFRLTSITAVHIPRHSSWSIQLDIRLLPSTFVRICQHFPAPDSIQRPSLDFVLGISPRRQSRTFTETKQSLKE
jgi:hypothetical protein